MQMCGNPACCSSPAGHKCARCKGVFYCSDACQMTDWKRHTPYCKPLPSAEVGLHATRHGVQLAPVETLSEVDYELFDAVTSFINTVQVYPKSLRNHLLRVLKVVRSLLDRGARPYVLLASADNGWRWSRLGRVCKSGCPGMEPRAAEAPGR